MRHFINFLAYYRCFCSFANLRVLCMVFTWYPCYTLATIKRGEQAEQPALDNSPQHTHMKGSTHYDCQLYQRYHRRQHRK